jgi:ribosomal protein S18 acetylase RimI-like enzyme
MNIIIERAFVSDAEEILLLQKLAYRSEAEIYDDYRIEPLVQTLDQLQEQFEDHVILKAVIHETIIGSVRASEHDGTCYIGKLIVHPNYQNKGIGTMLMNAIEGYFQQSRYELFTGSKSEKNMALYERLGYKIFRQRSITPDLNLVYLVKEQAVVER